MNCLPSRFGSVICLFLCAGALTDQWMGGGWEGRSLNERADSFNCNSWGHRRYHLQPCLTCPREGCGVVCGVAVMAIGATGY